MDPTILSAVFEMVHLQRIQAFLLPLIIFTDPRADLFYFRFEILRGMVARLEELSMIFLNRFYRSLLPTLILSLVATFTQIANFSHAETPGFRPCTSELEYVGVTPFHLTRKITQATQDCLVVFSGYRDSRDSTRSFFWKGNGDFTVIIGMNEEDPDDSALYVRSFTLFPRKITQPDFHVLPNGDIAVTHSNDARFEIDRATGNLRSYSGGTLSLASRPHLDPKDRGGVEIYPKTGVLLDYGWRKDGHPKDKVSGISEFRDSLGKTCQVKNKEFLKPIYTPAGKVDEYEIRFQTDTELNQFLTQKCPHLEALDR